MSPLLPSVPPLPRPRHLAAFVALAAALGAVPTPAQAADAGRSVARTVAARSRTKGRTRAHAKARSKAHAKVHTKTHARLHTRGRVRVHALSTVASAGEVEAGGASLRGSHAAVDHAYDAAVRGNVPFVQSNAELAQRAVRGEYVPLEISTPTYQLKGVGSPYVRPATRDFVNSFAAEYVKACGEPLTVTSAMRPSAIRLRNSVEKTVHPTGMAVDLRAPRTACRAWMRTTLLGLERGGTIDATEEHHPAHFHVVVLP